MLKNIEDNILSRKMKYVINYCDVQQKQRSYNIVDNVLDFFAKNYANP